MIFRRRSSRENLVDLTPEVRVTNALLGQPYDWRRRIVESVDIATELSAVVKRSLQVAPLREVLRSATGRSLPNHARLVLPIATLRKGPVVDFDVTVPGASPASMISRRAIAEREAAYVESLASEAGIGVSGRLREVVTAICEFTPAPWDDIRKDCPDPAEAIRNYLGDGLGAEPEEMEELLTRWRPAANEIGAILNGALEEPYDERSSADNPLLVVPYLVTNGVKDVDAALNDLLRFVEQAGRRASASAEPSAASDLLAVLGDYGRSWEVMVDCEVPLDRPFEAHMTQRRPMELSRRGRTSIELVIADGSSNHVLVTVTDTNVQIADVQAINAGGETSVLLASARQSSEYVSYYFSDPDRDYRTTLRLTLRLGFEVRTTQWLFILLTGLVTALVWLVRPLTIGDLAVLVVPTTFATSLLLTRERSSLATWLKSPTQYLLAAAVTVLWASVAYLYIDGQVHDADRHAAGTWVSHPRVSMFGVL